MPFRKFILINLFAIFYLLFAINTSFAQSINNIQTTITGEHIENFDVKIKVNKDGTIDVTETIDYDFSDLDKYGIFRTIPYIKTNQDGKKFEMEIASLTVKDENGVNYKFTPSTKDNHLNLKIGDPNKTITGKHTYAINYKVSGALTYFSDHDELYWNITGNEWNVPIKTAISKIILPNNISQQDIKVECFTGNFGSTETNCSSSIVENEVTTKTQDILFAKQGLTIVAGFPKNSVTVLEPIEKIDFFDTPQGKIVLNLILITIGFIFVLWYLVYPTYLPLKWYFAGRDPETGGPVRAWFDPPQTEKRRPLTPAETGTLIDENAQVRDIFSTIVDLARRGYLKIVEKKKGDFYFAKTKPNKKDQPLLPFEEKLYNKIFEDENEVKLKDLKLYTTVEEVKKMIYEDLVTEGFFPKNPSSIRTFYSVIAGIAIFTLNIFLFIVALIFGRNMAKKTLFGAQQANVGKSLKNFLTSQERQLTFQAKNQMMFEKLLPYAIAFGVEKVWVERFKDINITTPKWYQGYNMTTFNTAVFMHSLNSSYSSFSSHSTPTSSSSGFSSGFSGGGFSGGGGGGGGGGSW